MGACRTAPSRFGDDRRGWEFYASAGPDGAYKMCLARYLATCPWTGAVSFAILQGRAPAIALLRMTSGIEVHVRINDPSQLAVQTKNRPTPLTMGILDSFHTFHPMPMVSQDQNGEDLSITAPIGVPLHLWLFSSTLRVKDSAGIDIDRTKYAFPFQIAAGMGRLDFVFTVAGLK